MIPSTNMCNFSSGGLKYQNMRCRCSSCSTSRCFFFCLYNTLRPRQNGRHFPDDIFKWIFLNENVWISINISLKFVPRGPINNIPTLVQVMAWRRPGDKPLSEPMMVRLPTHICITPPQWQLGHHRWYWRLLLWQGIMANLHFQCPLWLHHWNWGNHMIVPVSVKWPWTIWVTDPIHSWMRYTT